MSRAKGNVYRQDLATGPAVVRGHTIIAAVAMCRHRSGSFESKMSQVGFLSSRRAWSHSVSACGVFHGVGSQVNRLDV